ncbi:DUF3833 family protein [Reyranella sp.]|jgi:hypothetical protein|uniref:DUF3833 family protein n=1 Tax=Reyranella sp. TaxID=1929291 RepID=UPI000BDC725E|nr:DUF3833 family protein [Reyranella sp.]OYY37233.1 MAG: hypothetical protein B7Y57_23560 [Rhodospirillales bacterium 35-66-84]OYZ94205.1 MAG: hypothetical protein B7Y08_13795 [Rhodospirillales bacterium 24-66-33]OZB23045.1 MAG: hypothetical protein B7X63_20940 [Rhodospirillales bacterium 39-66-50]HQS17222.1 DUF3833 family protein [Reyranella sp.]HQT13707.1 DUF3833 family protein [Reyranella sp.]
MDIDDFAGTSPELLPETYLAGDLEGWGVVERVTGGLQQRFTVKAQGTWDEAARILHFVETWTFDDGRQDTLTWRISKLASERYSGQESRLDGEAEGDRAGCAFHWRYTRDTPQGGGDDKSMVLNFNDWFYRIDERVVMVRGSAGRAGIPFSILHATYRRL